MSQDEVKKILAGPVTVEEKVDGANVGISVESSGNLRLQNRGKYLERGSAHPQFRPLFSWLEARRARLRNSLSPDLILFGEWCFAVHSIRYTKLPDWFLAFDVYDRAAGRFWSVNRRLLLLEQLEISAVPRIASGRYAQPRDLIALLGKSRLGETPAEGVYIRRDDDLFLVSRAKLVRAEFNQTIEAHWTERPMERNQLSSGVTW